ncbi:hypothetical protein I315_00949 [Cryptococcus gattii Ru294]|uniref:Uncharacterized protein n=2 Tax=Cryptococcus gattii TaxID=37769 RepID=E6RAE5_CRYGW|nr:Hypothetical Protein CGB_H1110C [Cryptococcus gattii WM276]KIR56765.1 hypothetical protein I315_00949 [Cryptococcus gattii Ru294]KIR81512.1 hypothetical protein I306_01348 [Cryptococcus gattii EJB2]KIY31790.1 hypothetical protein I305_05750 [Cryptococcus gattii E566]KJE02253.1 hypothetical protein I311_04132 [Cryptococcus gattii NT-10]ADV23867.1 Hypothetical Protein CGB_H1110C [Cryptococcus gattii WM276]
MSADGGQWWTTTEEAGRSFRCKAPSMLLPFNKRQPLLPS